MRLAFKHNVLLLFCVSFYVWRLDKQLDKQSRCIFQHSWPTRTIDMYLVGRNPSPVHWSYNNSYFYAALYHENFRGPNPNPQYHSPGNKALLGDFLEKMLVKKPVTKWGLVLKGYHSIPMKLRGFYCIHQKRHGLVRLKIWCFSPVSIQKRFAEDHPHIRTPPKFQRTKKKHT